MKIEFNGEYFELYVHLRDSMLPGDWMSVFQRAASECNLAFAVKITGWFRGVVDARYHSDIWTFFPDPNKPFVHGDVTMVRPTDSQVKLIILRAKEAQLLQAAAVIKRRMAADNAELQRIEDAHRRTIVLLDELTADIN